LKRRALCPPRREIKTSTEVLESAQEGHEIALLIRIQFPLRNQNEEFDRVLQRQQSTVMQIGRAFLDAAKRRGLDLTVRCDSKASRKSSDEAAFAIFGSAFVNCVSAL
jgi:hypothetical protein